MKVSRLSRGFGRCLGTLTLVLSPLSPKLRGMALSKHDQAFYEEKLGWKAFGFLFGATVLIGAILWPLLLFIQDWSAGQTGKWTFNVAFDLAVMGFLLGTVVAVVMYLAFKFLLSMGWLPSRR
jgi:hypothetical protein